MRELGTSKPSRLSMAAEKGNEYFNTFLQEVLADPKGGRSEYSPATQEFIAQLYSWNLLSRTQRHEHRYSLHEGSYCCPSGCRYEDS